FHGELHADIARVVLAIDEGGTVDHLNVRELLERNLLPAGGCNENIADFVRVVAVLLIEAHDQIELLLSLFNLRRHVPTNGRLNERVDIGDVDAVARDLGTVDVDGETRLPELLHQCDVAYATHPLQNLLDRLTFLLERVQIGAKDLYGKRALQTRL